MKSKIRRKKTPFGEKKEPRATDRREMENNAETPGVFGKKKRKGGESQDEREWQKNTEKGHIGCDNGDLGRKMANSGGGGEGIGLT